MFQDDMVPCIMWPDHPQHPVVARDADRAVVRDAGRVAVRVRFAGVDDVLVLVVLELA